MSDARTGLPRLPQYRSKWALTGPSPR